MNQKIGLIAALGLLGIGIGGVVMQPQIHQIFLREPMSQANATTAENIAAFNAVLNTYVTDQGLVNYPSLQSHRTNLDAYTASIASLDPQTFDSWSEAQQIAFLINAYNALTLESIINESPIKKSIKNILGVWKIRKHPLLQTQVTLDDLEHKMLRAQYQEPRIHMALVCAALSCPSLRTEAYEGDRLNQQLEEQVRLFLRRDEAFRIDRARKEVHLSAIFDWFGQDWIPQYGSKTGFAGSEKERAVLHFISGYVSEADQTFLKSGQYQIKYAPYDWALNQQTPRSDV